MSARPCTHWPSDLPLPTLGPRAPDVSVLAQGSLGIDIWSKLRDRYREDPFFRTILDKPKEFRNFELEDQLIYLRENDRRVLCIPKVMVQSRSAREIIISEAHSMLVHLGAAKTVDYLRDHVWWKDLVSDVKAYCETCSTCKTSKPSNKKPYGLLNPLEVPTYPWESMGIDFVGPLPESGNRDGMYDSITVVICLLTSMVHLIPSRTNYNATQLAELMFEHVYKLHGLPKNIVSDRDVLFTSVFWSRLHRLIGTKLRMSSAYHPQSDGATERANRTVTQMLRQCIHPNQKDWVTKLPAIEFAINSARSVSTGYAPFFLNFGRMPKSMIWPSSSSSEYPSVRDFALQKKLALMAAHDSILAARVKQTKDANKKRQSVPFKTGDLAYLSTKNISFPRGLARKLLPKFLGPYKILQDFGNASFQLDLPPQLKRRGVHDVFHSSLLRIHIPNDDRLFPGRMDTQLAGDEDTEGEWAVDRISAHAGKRTDSVFEVHWKSGDITWLPYYQITHLQALTDYFELLGIHQVSQLPEGTGRPPTDDPQIYVGFVSPSPFLINSPRFSPSPFKSAASYITRPLQQLRHAFSSLVTTPFVSPTVDLVISITMPGPLRSVDHPRFTRLSATHYLLRDPANSITSTVHVGQIADFLNFDERVRRQGLHTLHSMPLGFGYFAELWNTGARQGDLRRLSYLGTEQTAGSHSKAVTIPVHNADFFITPEQVGLASDTNSTDNTVQNEIVQEFAVIMMDQRRNKRRGYEGRRERRICSFSDGPASQPDTVLSRLNFQSKRSRASSYAPSMAMNHPSSSTSTAVSSPTVPAPNLPLVEALPRVEEQEQLAAEQEPLGEEQEHAPLPENPEDDYSSMETME